MRSSKTPKAAMPGSKRTHQQESSMRSKRIKADSGSHSRGAELDIDSETFEELMNEYGIEFLGALSQSQWPADAAQIFRKISEIKKIAADDYDPNKETLRLNETGQAIEWEIGRRARLLVSQALQCRKQFANEITWRLKTEVVVLARFYAETACPQCRARIWISDFVAPAADPQSAMKLQKRREKRDRCGCDPATRPVDYTEAGLSRIFKDHAGIAVVHDPNDRLTEKGLKLQQPDRVFGLQATRNIKALLPSLGVRRHSPVNGHILPYPFLILEAKSEKHGHGFGSIERQTAFPIRTLLKIQGDLRSAAGADCHFKPIVWFLANQGDQWRVYSCMMLENKFSIIDVWQGSVLNEDFAVQLLLIIDYICDWARDIYRPMIIKCLSGVYNYQNAGDLAARETSPSDSNIWSRNQGVSIPNASVHAAGPRENCSEVIGPVNFQYVNDDGTARYQLASKPVDQSHLFMRFARPLNDEYWDWTRFAVITHASIIRYTFTRLHLKDENISTFVDEIMSYRDKRCSQRWILDLLYRLASRPVMVDGNTLDQIEHAWTGRGPNSTPATSCEDMLTALSYRTYFGYDYWQITREIICITSTRSGPSLLAEKLNQALKFNGDKKVLPSDLRRLWVVPGATLRLTVNRIRDWTDRQSVIAAAVCLQWDLFGRKSLGRSRESYLPAYWDGQDCIRDPSEEMNYETHKTPWARGTHQDLEILEANLDTPDPTTLELKYINVDGEFLHRCSTSLREVAIAPTDDYPPFELPKLPESVDHTGILLLQRAAPHIFYPRLYCMVVFEKSSFENSPYLATKIGQSFNAGEMYNVRVANQPTTDNLGKVPIAGLTNNVTGAIHLWTSRLLGRKPVWSDWQFYLPQYRTKDPKFSEPVAESTDDIHSSQASGDDCSSQQQMINHASDHSGQFGQRPRVVAAIRGMVIRKSSQV